MAPLERCLKVGRSMLLLKTQALSFYFATNPMLLFLSSCWLPYEKHGSSHIVLNGSVVKSVSYRIILALNSGLCPY